MSKEQMRLIVEDGAAAFADLDRALQACDDAAVRIVKVMRRGVLHAMVKPLEGKQMIGAARELVGMIGAVEKAAGLLHAESTKAAKANGVDTGPLVTVGGVVLPAGGGPR